MPITRKMSVYKEMVDSGAKLTLPESEDPDLFDQDCDPVKPKVIEKSDVLEAHYRIKGGVVYTPCPRSKLSEQYDCQIYFKKEYMQNTGSFKERGARNILQCLNEEERRVGVIAASAGNHAQALAFHGRDLGIPVTVFMPSSAPLMKIENCAKMGAKVIVKGHNFEEAKKYAMKYGKTNNLKYVNGYDHPMILAGQGSVGFEIMEQVPDVDVIIVPVGGGGLLAGIATAVKGHKKHVKIYSVESKRAPGWQGAIDAGKPVYTPCLSTLADGLSVPIVGYNAFETCKGRVDGHFTIDESHVARAIIQLLETEKAVVEGAGAISLGSLMADVIPDIKDKKVVCVLCGGNIDTSVLGRVIERGLAIEKRLARFEVIMPDRPGSIYAISELLFNMGAGIKHIHHEGAWLFNDTHSVNIIVIIETRDADHFEDIKSALDVKFKRIKWCQEVPPTQF